jgi:serine/threonine protein kinase
LAKRATVGPGAGDSVPAGGVSFEVLPVEFGRYRVQKVLGQGAMGAVYLAHDTKLARDVALKTPKLDAFADGEMVERFEREARSAATLHHRNVCPVFDVGEINGIRFLTMAYIEGRPLSEFVSEDEPMSRKQAATVIRKLALGLQEAHDHGVVHRDLKPANVMIDNSREPVVMDFGLAPQTENADQSRLTGVGVLMGSPAYMSPEQVSGEPDAVGHATDIYSLGVILFELLTGRLPFEGGVAAIIGQILTSDPPDVRALRSAIDEDLAQICLKMMAKSTENRFASMKEVADILGDYLRNIKKRTTVGSTAQSVVVSDLVFDDTTVSAVSVSAAKPKTKARRKKFNRNTKYLARWIGGGLLGMVVLTGVIIKFGDGTTLDIPDGKTATIATNDDGSLKSLTVLLTSEDLSQASPEFSSQSANGNISQDGFVDLFNGRDLTGWQLYRKGWSVKDGVLVGSGSEWIMSDAEFFGLRA